ncbi:sporulation protein [Paenibacillus sp. IHB B 3084]|uniref:YtrH family sporulation protein n=1 Tax=Paenibacillus TaxID=44249 RepID=UPI000722E3E3|nr:MULTISPECIES: YtrH family sporulation protein [Paenibacillus]ALP35327.1 sporulation protein [Paenibacillus sp. IHB B 3084]MBE0337961.1 sporulation protein [Paenibacillus sp. 23TSA30-6]
MSTFISKAILDFFIAFGIVLGGAMLGGMGAVVSLQPPTQTMLEVAGRIKIWALAAAVGGTMDPIRVIESNMLDGNLSPAIKQILYLIFAFLGAHMGAELVKWVCGNARP